MSKQYRTKTGISLTVISGGGMGDGVPKGELKLVSPNDTAPASDSKWDGLQKALAASQFKTK